MIRPLNLPKDFVTLTEQQFAQAYIAACEKAGSDWSTLAVVKSWHNYQRDPAGHFITKHIAQLTKENQTKE